MFQVVSRPTDSSVGPVGFSKHYVSHSQGVGPATVPRQDPVSCSDYGARLKTTGLARQTESAWAGAGPTELQPSSGVPLSDSTAAETGYGLPAYLGHSLRTLQLRPDHCITLLRREPFLTGLRTVRLHFLS